MVKANPPRILERGDIYFFYRPKVHEQDDKEVTPTSINEIQRFYLVLKPEQDPHYRLCVIGKKRLPGLSKHEKYWGVVDLVAKDPQVLIDALKEAHYHTKTRGERVQPEVRACGEGGYFMVRQGKNSYLAYRLSLPKRVSEVQKVFRIAAAATYQISVKNQLVSGVQGGKKADFPLSLQDKMGDLHFYPLDPPDFLNYAGAEILLIGVDSDTREQVIAMSCTKSRRRRRDNALNPDDFLESSHVVKPLLEGEWR